MANPQGLNIDAVAKIKGTRTTITVLPPEDPDDKSLRLHREKFAFWFKELGPIVLAGLIVVVVMICCTVILVRADSAAVDRDNAWKAIFGVLGVVVGTLFGRATSRDPS